MPLHFAATSRDSTVLKENDFGSLSHRNNWIIFFFLSVRTTEQPLYWECWRRSYQSCCGTRALTVRAVRCYCFWGHGRCPPMNAVVLSNENLSSAKKYFPFCFCNKAVFPLCYHLIWRRLVTSTNHFVPSVKKIIAGSGLILFPVTECDFVGCCMV